MLPSSLVDMPVLGGEQCLSVTDLIDTARTGLSGLTDAAADHSNYILYDTQ